MKGKVFKIQDLVLSTHLSMYCIVFTYLAFFEQKRLYEHKKLVNFRKGQHDSKYHIVTFSTILAGRVSNQYDSKYYIVT